jgi:hypothetical protein
MSSWNSRWDGTHTARCLDSVVINTDLFFAHCIYKSGPYIIAPLFFSSLVFDGVSSASDAKYTGSVGCCPDLKKKKKGIQAL